MTNLSVSSSSSKLNFHEACQDGNGKIEGKKILEMFNNYRDAAQSSVSPERCLIGCCCLNWKIEMKATSSLSLLLSLYLVFSFFYIVSQCRNSSFIMNTFLIFISLIQKTQINFFLHITLWIIDNLIELLCTMMLEWWTT